MKTKCEIFLSDKDQSGQAPGKLTPTNLDLAAYEPLFLGSVRQVGENARAVQYAHAYSVAVAYCIALLPILTTALAKAM